MPERYQGPIQIDTTGKTRQIWHGKWVRHYEDIYVSSPSETNPSHRAIVYTMKISDAIEETRQSNPEQVDAGDFSIDNFDTLQVQRKQIKLVGKSSGLGLPEPIVEDQARIISIEVWSAQSPGFNVINKEI